MRLRAAAACLAVAAAGGCMSGASTFEQALAYQRWKWCDTFPSITLQRIDTDGLVVVSGGEADRDAFLRCMAERAREQQKSRPSLVVPEPVVNPR